MASPTFRPCRPGQRGQAGYTYIGLMFLVAVMGITLAAAGMVWRTQAQREHEAELLFIGRQFTAAIARYYENTPVGQRPGFPAKLEDLLDDRRWPVPRRHLRRIFIDPMTASTEWGLVRTPAPDNRIMGVYSLSKETPLKRTGFGWPYDAGDIADITAALTYQDWRFIYVAPGDRGN
ncbi:type II secretion system protein [Variovorax sp.]|uniref:type II secretion system protein n=1 Tax=Variovorax sp. TaxID=1871043 RepID=UPI002D67E951|nr:type II secretion system protein [Variovorax sp.]HYP85380.1 type II secretion system protein [Variovorax sp.]